jgi:hypothetical protein
MRAFVAAALLAAACATPAILTPATGPGTEWGPCGVHGVSCPGHLCCEEGETCTADGMCEFVEPNPVMSRRATHRQRPEK